jgi:hypothetical protein
MNQIHDRQHHVFLTPSELNDCIAKCLAMLMKLALEAMKG